MVGLMIVLLCLPVAQAQELGSLFFTPERRQSLDRQRELNVLDTQTMTLTINGVVTRRNGKRTVWINGVAQNENETPSNISVIPKDNDPGKIIVNIDSRSNAQSSVGDTLNRTTGEIVDGLKGGLIRSHGQSSVKQ